MKYRIPLLSVGVTLILLALLLLLPPALTRAQEDSSGSIAFLGLDGNVYLLKSLDANPVPLTADAQRGIRSYYWPTWSTDGRLAFFAEEATPGGVRLQAQIVQAGQDTPAVAYESDEDSFTYAYWAPANCPLSANCRDLAVLTTTSAGLSVVRIRDEAPDFSAERIGSGGPFYYSYSPDATHMIWQRFGRQLDLYDALDNEIIEALPDSVGMFQAPMWSPVDDRLLFVTVNADGEQALVIAEGEARTVLTTVSNPGDILFFAWSPDGRYVAYKTNFGSVHVLDSASGQEVALTNQDLVVAFFWSPDSSHLAYLSVPNGDSAPQAALPGGGGLASPAEQRDPLAVLSWHVLDVNNNTNQGFAPFRTSADMRYLIAFFDQFAQSHRLWSPDSRYLVYGALAESGAPRPSIQVLDTLNPQDAPRTIAEGTIGIWSYR